MKKKSDLQVVKEALEKIDEIIVRTHDWATYDQSHVFPGSTLSQDIWKQ
jgi:hypothetical protein